MKRAGLFAGILLFAAIYGLWRPEAAPDRHPLQMRAAAALTALMAVWWMTEAAPIAITSILPLALLPTFGGVPMKTVAPNYANPQIFLFFGGFFLAIAMERTGLHRRIALAVVRLIGGGQRRLVLGFMVATAFLSCWISNTATTLLMLPIAMAVARRFEGEPRFQTALLLSIAYASSIGGMSTLIGTPTNICLPGALSRMFPEAPEITFARWLRVGLPCAMLFLPLAWLALVRGLSGAAAGGREEIDAERRALGPIRPAERRVLVVFLATTFLWIFLKPIEIGRFRIPGWSALSRIWQMEDAVVSIAMGVLLFFIPSGEPGRRLMEWREAEARMPWGTLLLFGGGFVIATSFEQSGLSAHIGAQAGFLRGLPAPLLIAAFVASVTLLSEVTSNTATAQVLLPVVAGIATNSLRCDPLLLMVPVTLAASSGFMLPVATPPNSIVFATGLVPVGSMIRAGFLLNLIGIVVITAVCWFLLPSAFGVDFGAGVPVWAR